MRLIPLVLLSQLVLAGPLASASDTVPRLRPMDNDSRELIARGMDQSPTFRRLVRRLEASDVIVYVRLRPDMPDRLGGSLRFVTRSTTDRFLMVTLNRRTPPTLLVALLGHELQHVAEVADAREVDSPLALRGLYRRIGRQVQLDGYDTRAAQLAGYAVRDELTHGPIDVRMARHVPAIGGDDALLDGGSYERLEAQ